MNGTPEEQNMNEPQNEPSFDGPGGASPQNERGGSSKGPLIGSIIIIVLLVIAGIYVFTTRPEQPAGETGELAPEEILEKPDPTLEELETQGSSDNIDAIEKDVEKTSLEDLDAELQAIEAELDEFLAE